MIFQPNFKFVGLVPFLIRRNPLCIVIVAMFLLVANLLQKLEELKKKIQFLENNIFEVRLIFLEAISIVR